MDEKRKPRSAKPRSGRDDELLRQLGRKVTTLRVALNMSPEDLARKAKLHRSYVRKLEQGAVNPSTLVLAAISHALSTEIPELFLTANEHETTVSELTSNEPSSVSIGRHQERTTSINKLGSKEK